MKGLQKFWLLLCVLAVGLLILGAVLLGNGEAPAETVPTTLPSTQPTVSAQEQYASAREAVEEADNLVLTYTVEKERVIGENRFTESVTGTASVNGLGSRSMTAMVEETLEFDAYSCEYSEAFCEGAAYAIVNDCRFRVELTPQAFADRLIPAVLLTESLYKTVECQPGEDTTVIVFADPTGLESWVDEGTVTSASGSALLDGEGNLLQTEYAAQYSTDCVQYTLRATVQIKTPEQLDLSAIHIAHGQSSVPLSDLDIPRFLVQTVADVYSAAYISCNMTENIHSEALPMTYTQKSDLKLQGFQEELEADAVYEVVLTDQRGQSGEKHQAEQFRDGVYSVSVDGGESTQDGKITALAMRQYCEDTILSGLFAMKYVDSTQIQTEDNLIRMTFSGNNAFCDDLMSQLGDFLQVDLDAQAQGMETLKAGGYLTMDTQTGLPTAMGMAFERSHTLDGVRYILRYQLDEELSFTSE